MKRYENAVRVITAFFAVLLGFGLKRLLDSTTFSPPNALWPCFFLSVLLFLRFLLGSTNHMWFEFVRPDLKQDSSFNASRTQLLNDFLFLVAFGLIGVGICYSQDLEQFLQLNLLLAGVGLTWVVAYAAAGVFTRKVLKRNDAISKGQWGYWGWINLIQFAAVLTVKCLIIPADWGTVPWWPALLPGDAWDISLLLLTLVYLVLLIVDVAFQLKNLEAAKS
jgi:hypothetical protein